MLVGTRGPPASDLSAGIGGIGMEWHQKVYIGQIFRSQSSQSRWIWGLNGLKNGLVQPPALKMIPAPGRPYEPPTLGRHKLTARCHRIAERSTSSSWEVQNMEWPWDALGALWCPWIPHGMCGRWVSRSGMVVWCGVGYGGTCYCVWYMVLWDVILCHAMPCLFCVVHAWVVSVMMCNVSWQWNKHAAKRGKGWLKIHTGSWHERKPSKFETNMYVIWFFCARWMLWSFTHGETCENPAELSNGQDYVPCRPTKDVRTHGHHLGPRHMPSKSAQIR